MSFKGIVYCSSGMNAEAFHFLWNPKASAFIQEAYPKFDMLPVEYLLWLGPCYTYY